MTPTLLLVAVLAAVPLSQSKLGVRVVGSEAPAGSLLAACPRLAVFPIVPSNGTAGAQIAAYEAGCSGGVALAQVGDDGLAAAVAQQTIPTWLSLVPDGATAVEAPAVSGTAPEVLAFWTAFASSVQAMQPQRIPVLAVAPGFPCPAATGTWWWSWRARSPLTQGADETPTTLGYRAVRDTCASLTGVPIALTDIAPATPPWQASDAPWLRWFEARLAEDAEVKGAALSSAGAATAATSLEPVLDSLLAELANPSPSDGGTPDAGVDGGGGVVTPHPGTDGDLVPVHTKGCACGSGGGALLAIAPLLLALRRRR
jgi:hypothetical protein